MKKNLIGLAVASAFAFAASVASADDVSYSGAWYTLPGVNVLNADSDAMAENQSVGGFLKFGKEISERWDVQIGLSHNRADENRAEFSDGKYRQTLFGVDALYFFSRDKFRPFLIAGVGAARNKIDYTETVGGGDWGGKKTSWMANVGFGAQYLFNESFGLQADVRQVWSRGETGPVGDRDTAALSNTYLNLGAIFRFGAPKPAPVVEPTPEPVAVAPEPAPAPAPAPAPVGPAEPAFEKVTLSSEVLFGFDNDNLKEEGKAALNADVVEKMKAHHQEVELVLITGHTDRIGDDAYNQKLSERRANTVKKYLVSQGIEESRLHAVGKGESEPVVECAGVRGKKAIECLQPNRRVIVEIEVQRASE